jgi:cytochrome d ubiquinol oxidase subunit II
MKTEGDLRLRAAEWSVRLLVLVVVFMAVVSVWAPLLRDDIAARWFSWPNIAYLSPVPILVALVSWQLWRAVVDGSETLPFILSMVLFVLGYAGLGISLWPNVVPPRISIWEASSSPATQRFLLTGCLFVLPLLLGYTAYAYWVFRGKVRTETGYH